MRNKPVPIAWLEPGEAFPALDRSWGTGSSAPGLLAAGGALDIETLQSAYRQGIFPWFSDGQPILWWSPDPRMVLEVRKFRLRPSLSKTLKKFIRDANCEIRIDSAFDEVIAACASSLRNGEAGTWIVPEMIAAYRQLHRAGLAHSIETWINGQLCGGLYCVALGQAVYGESMFTRKSNSSKIALAALVGFCSANGIEQIDCQQNTPHLASLGANEVSRAHFLEGVDVAIRKPAPRWHFEPLYWQAIMNQQ